MAVDIKIPAVGESIKEARLVRWLKHDGDYVKADEPVAELETDKASDNITAPTAGILHTSVKEDQVVAIGTVIGRIEPGVPPPSNKKQEPVPKPAVEKKPVAKPAEAKDDALPPAAQHIVAEKDADHDTQATRQDVQVAVKVRGERETRSKMSPIRQRIAERLVQSQHTTATLTTFNEADMSAISELRARSKEWFKEKHGVGLGFMSFFVQGAVKALKAFPNLNARIDANDIVQQHFYDIGVAVSTDRGLMVPVLRDADQLSFADIEKKITELAALARDGKISTSHLQGGTFTITNGGVFGSLLSTPILNPPQCAILGMHTIQKRPVVVNDQIVIRPMMYLALSYDHRLIDGKEAVQFLVAVKEYVENPVQMLFDM